MNRCARVATGLGILGVHVLLWIIHDLPEPRRLSGDEVVYWQVAVSLARGQDVQMPPLWPPLQAHVLALWLRASGESLLAFRLFQTGLLVLASWLARDLVLRCTGWRVAADATAVWMLAYPPLVAYCHYLWPEILHLTLMLGAAWVLVVHRKSFVGSAAVGALLGAALLTKSLLAPLLPIVLVPLAAFGTWRGRAARCAIATAAFVAVLAPTLADGDGRRGGLLPTGSAWFNVWVGLQDGRRDHPDLPVVEREFVRFQAQPGSFAERNAELRERSFELVRERGWWRVLGDQLSKQYFRLFDKESFLTEQLPGGSRHRQGAGYPATPAPVAGLVRGLSHALYATLLVSSVAGLVLCWPRKAVWVVAPLVFLAYNLLLFLVLHVKTRYRIPILPVFFLFSGVAVQWALEARRRRGEAWAALAVPSVYAALLGGALALLLLLLAFGSSLLR